MNFKTKLTFIDFDDSFSFNIISYFKMFFNVEILHWKNFEKAFGSKSEYLRHNIVLGPGPGHVSDYRMVQKVLNERILIGEEKYLGICLGHQLLWTSFGGKVEKSNEIMHGRTTRVNLSKLGDYFGINLNHSTLVQRYNSWTCVPDEKISTDYLYDEFNKDMLGFSRENVLGIQFHPESIGTEAREDIFECFYYYFSKNTGIEDIIIQNSKKKNGMKNEYKSE